ncbi:GNAT family N-acetyltransferase [Streptomyces sp. NPDC085614]|uniref:GNAT family N-acetyltransferase n=1 Tax=Streptomyces sp. NPDC085614 TaxID=3365733 RepID=UPI0037D2FB9E
MAEEGQAWVVTVMGAGTQEALRPFRGGDRLAVLDLIGADLLPGRPYPTDAMLDLAVQEAVPGGRRAPGGLEGVRTEVLASAGGQVLGVVCWAVRSSDDAGMLLWLHCLEDEQPLARALVRHVTGRLGRRTVHAFAEPTALAPAGLAVRNRPGTRRALEECGFSGTDRWRYLHHRLETRSGRLYAVADLVECPDAQGWHLRLRERDGTCIGEAFIAWPVDGTTALEWVRLAPGRYRLGHVLLEQCLDHLADRGVREVTAHLAAPGEDRPYLDAALELHTAAGFTEIDQLHTYTRRP